jgi:pilus assembly protein Flp/PilA
MLTYIRKVTRSRDEGASAVEYGLLVAAIAALVVIIVFSLGGLVKEVFTDTCTELKTEANNGGAAIAENCDN